MTQDKVKVTIRGIAPLLMHAFPLEPITAFEKLPKEKQAEHAAYRDPDSKELYVPGIAIQRCLIQAATYSKGKGRASLQKETAASVLVSPERVSLGQKNYAIDSRPVVVPATKGRVIRHRPRIEPWELTFDVEFDPTLMTEPQLRKVIDDAGSRVGLLDFRPEKKGSFGRFMVVAWNGTNGK